MKNREDIHTKFSGKRREYWEEAGFNYQQFKDWVDLGLTLDNSIFAWWLVNEKELTPKLDLNIKKLKEEYDNWKKEWSRIHISFEPLTMMRWKKRSFDVQETEQWMDAGLEHKEYELASQLKENGITPEQYANFKNKDAQEWLNYFYPKEKRDKIKKLNIRKKDLENSLNLEGFSNLEELDCSRNKLTKLNISDCSNLKRLYCSDNQLTDLNTNILTKLQEINCENNKLINLDCSNCSQLELLDCSYNELTKLILTNCSSITELQCYNNHLDNFNFLLGLGNENLVKINASNNKIKSSSLTPFAQFINLQVLNVGNNYHLSCSLEPLKYLDKLEILVIFNTDMDSGLEYLPESIQYFYCSAYQPERKVKIIEQELASYKDKTEENKYDFQKWRDENIVKIIPTLPPSLGNEKGIKLTESYEIKEINYNKIYPESSLSQKIDKSIILPSKKLPFKLYNISNKKVEKTENSPNIKNYAILSYVWGGDYDNKTGKLSSGGQKSLVKAIKTCSCLEVDHLWIDQWCIDQNNNEEKASEVSKMGQYYSNAVVTLIAIQTKAKVDEEELDLLDILKRITCSEWFTRSWTFQEGWLSKWTLFMFDDILVDGREIAALWVFQQPSHVGISFAKTDKGLKKIATPIGWTYYQKGYKPEDRVSLRLYEALREIKSRGRGNKVDGIYSILGLLPYGEKVKVEYKENLCKDCKRRETEQEKKVICEHPKEKRTEFAKYFKDELEERLLHIMKVALYNGYGEPLSWHGLGNGWLPQINEQGSTGIEGGIKVDYISQKDEEIIQTDGSLKITGSEYVITKSSDTMSHWDQSSSIESGARERKVWVKVNNKEEEIEILGTKSILSLIKKLLKENKNNIRLLVPNKYQWRSAKPFAILMEVKENNYYGLGLVEISEGSDKLQEVDEEEILVRVNELDPYRIKEKQIIPENMSYNDLEKLKEKLVKAEVERDEWKKKFQELVKDLGIEASILTSPQDQEKELQIKIKQLQEQLKELKNYAEDKLKSVNPFNKNQELLQSLLAIQEKIIRNPLTMGNIFVLNNELHSIKEQLSKKLTVINFNNLFYHAQTELIKAQITLERLQQNTQIQITPKQN